MIKVKNSQLDSETLDVINKIIDQKIKASAAFKLARIVKDLSSIVEEKMKQEKRILEKWAEKDADGTILSPQDADGKVIPNSVKIMDMNAFNQDMIDLMEVENELTHTLLKFDELGLETDITTKELLKIDFLFE
jgi:dsDNA-specific endonuclease/ATPase MutS2